MQHFGEDSKILKTPIWKTPEFTDTIIESILSYRMKKIPSKTYTNVGSVLFIVKLANWHKHIHKIDIFMPAYSSLRCICIRWVQCRRPGPRCTGCRLRYWPRIRIGLLACQKQVMITLWAIKPNPVISTPILGNLNYASTQVRVMAAYFFTLIKVI